MKPVLLNEPTPEENAAALKEMFAGMKQARAERVLAVEAARPALARLVEACAAQSGQSYILRRLLFSLWNGKAADLSDTLRLDWSLKKDLVQVALAFGADGFFYDEMSAALQARGFLQWFIEEGEL